MEELGPKAITELLEADPAVQLVDVRDDWELALAPYPVEVIHIPMDQIQGRLAELDPQRPVVVACRSGNRSRTVGGMLEQHGFQRVINLEGGILAWSAELDPAIPTY